MRALVTGGSGYFGRLLIPELVKRGYECISVDVNEGTPGGTEIEFVQADATDCDALDQARGGRKVDVIFHLASQIDFAARSQAELYRNNVESTRAVAELARKRRIPKVIFTSSNSVYLGNQVARPIVEADAPIPTDAYGRSKVESEELLLSYANDFDSVSIRSPNIMDAGRLGMLTILFDYIREGRKCWVLGGGGARHQCIYAQDLIAGCLKAVAYGRSGVFNIGSDNVPTIREMYQYVIDRAGTKARVASIPSVVALPPMKLAHWLGISPLGPYQFRMLTRDFVFDTAKIKKELDWSPTLTNREMLFKAYEYYEAHHEQLLSDNDVSANRQVLKGGVLRLVKALS